MVGDGEGAYKMSRSDHLSAPGSQIRPPRAVRRRCDGLLAAASLGRLHGSRPWTGTVEGEGEGFWWVFFEQSVISLLNC